MTKLSEAEIVGDDNEVRTLLDQLQDRKLFPAKSLIYHEDARPGYFGTWSRNSKIIGPRRPFGKDVVEFDYNYDSGEDWEEEPMGDVDDVLQDDGEDGDSEEADSDLDSWLVDDDEEPETYQAVRDASPPGFPDFSDMPPPPLKRKAVEPDKKVKKRKVVVPLIPFSKGPYWETRIGECEYEPFNSYRIQLFNGKLSLLSACFYCGNLAADTTFPIDPFTFVSTCVEEYRASLKNPTITSVPYATASSVSNVPGQVTTTTTNANDTPIPDTLVTANKKSAPVLKSSFPDVHLPYLFNKISELQMTSFVLLVETIYQDLRPRKVTKAAIEAKIREVGEKCREKKVWIVKPALRVCGSGCKTSLVVLSFDQAQFTELDSH